MTVHREHDSLQRDAAAWIARLTSGEATLEDAEALRRWRATSPGHDRAFRDAARVWSSLGPALAPAARPARTRRAVLAGAGLSMAAAAAGLVLSEVGVLPPMAALAADHATGVGEQKDITLPGGTSVRLGGGSALALDDAAGRRLTLLAGAAVFTVAGGPGNPVVVAAGRGDTAAVEGTFAVTHGIGDVLVECLEGRARVACGDGRWLEAGQALRYGAGGLGPVAATAPGAAAAWRNGLLVFHDRPLAEVVGDLNRHRTGKVIVAGDALAARRVSGVFHLDQPDEILAHLEQTLQARRIDLPGGIVVLR